MTDISKHPLLRQAHEVCIAIEQCGASPQLTDAVIKASNLLKSLDDHLVPDLEAADFSDALMWIKEGKRVQRAGWNGASQYVILIPGEHLARSAGYGFGEAIGEFTFGDVLALKNAQNIMQPGWVPSMGDLLATDWQVFVERPELAWPSDLELSYRTSKTNGTETLNFVSGLMPHQARVIEEHNELRDKWDKLRDFMNSDMFKSLPDDEQHRMAEQQLYMGSYVGVLVKRIRAFCGHSE